MEDRPRIRSKIMQVNNSIDFRIFATWMVIGLYHNTTIAIVIIGLEMAVVSKEVQEDYLNDDNKDRIMSVLNYMLLQRILFILPSTGLRGGASVLLILCSSVV